MGQTASSVLVLDDDPACLRAAAQVEPGADVVIHACRTTTEAERLLAHVQVDVAVVDHDLGTQPSGLQWLGWLRRKDADCFRIITTDHGDLDFAIGAINQGLIDGFLPKPWRDHQLLQLLHQGCEAALIRRHNRSLANELGERNGQLLDLTARLEREVEHRTQHLREAMDQVRSAHEELQTQQQRLVGLETDGAIAQVVRGLAHELNNPLGVILGYAQRLRRTWAKDDAEASRRLDIILGEVDRCVSLVDQLRNLSVPLSEPVQAVRPETALAQAEASLREQGRSVPACVVPVPVPPVLAASRALARIFSAILDNAIAAGAHRIELTARLESGRVRLELANDGETPDDNQVRNATRPFFTTRAQQGNRGLGLAMAHALLRDQDGVIELQRGPQGGAVVVITLPAASRQPARPPSGPVPMRVLVVDDDNAVGALLVETIIEQGHAAEHVQTARQARQAVIDGGFGIALVDRNLNDGDGLLVADELAALAPGLAGRIALVTGDAGDAAITQAGVPVLAKPFRSDAVGAMLSRLAGG